MPVHMKKHHTDGFAHIIWNGSRYVVPVRIIEQYKATDEKITSNANFSSIDAVFGDLISEYGEPGVLLKGLRCKEDLTQREFADKIGITQANLSAMENGHRSIGKEIAKRIAKAFSIDYRMFL